MTFQPYQAYPGPAPVPVAPPPILVAVAGPMPQRRATVAFRAILVVPHLFLLYFMNLAAGVVLFIGWWGALFTGRLPQFAHSFLSGELRWVSRVWAYYFMLTDVYPPFGFDDDPTYPVRVAVPEPQRLNRAAVFFRYILLFPVVFLGAILLYGAGSLVAFVAWLMTLVAGQMPPALHLAYVAVLRYMARVYGYYWMLTAAYPGGLFGDQPGTVAWSDALPTGPAPGFGAPGFGTPAPGFGPPAPGYPAPGPGFGAPGQPYGAPAPAFGAPAFGGPAFGAPPFGGSAANAPQGFGAPGYGAPSAYGAPAYGAPAYDTPGYPPGPGYGGVAGYGARPVFLPVTWLLQLTAGARKLVVTFIVLGALFVPAYIGLEALFFTIGYHSASTAETGAFADFELDSAHTTLTTTLESASQDLSTCQGSPSCLSTVYAREASAYEHFESELAILDVPAEAADDQEAVSVAADTLQQDYASLARQPVSLATGAADEDTGTFNTAYTTLKTLLDEED